MGKSTFSWEEIAKFIILFSLAILSILIAAIVLSNYYSVWVAVLFLLILLALAIYFVNAT